MRLVEPWDRIYNFQIYEGANALLLVILELTDHDRGVIVATVNVGDTDGIYFRTTLKYPNIEKRLSVHQ